MSARDDIKPFVFYKADPEAKPAEPVKLAPRKLVIVDPDANRLIIWEIHTLDALKMYQRDGLDALLGLYASQGYTILDKRIQPPPLDPQPKRRSRKKSSVHRGGKGRHPRPQRVDTRRKNHVSHRNAVVQVQPSVSVPGE